MSSAWRGIRQPTGNRKVLRLLAIQQLLSVSSLQPRQCKPHTDENNSGRHKQQTFHAFLGRHWIRQSQHTCLVSSVIFFAEGRRPCSPHAALVSLVLWSSEATHPSPTLAPTSAMPLPERQTTQTAWSMHWSRSPSLIKATRTVSTL